MTDQPKTPPQGDAPEPATDQPLEETPAAAGGTDDSQPAQGEGDGNSH
ncbi:hypothetical protein [Gephyromycinifex aptenodytis]|nr:hypothetical protein [Gephyromycinifex aptenodytis]